MHDSPTATVTELICCHLPHNNFKLSKTHLNSNGDKQQHEKTCSSFGNNVPYKQSSIVKRSQIKMGTDSCRYRQQRQCNHSIKEVDSQRNGISNGIIAANQ
ncbi:unnamed protein product [Ceratitis capitata]|uniref:(Mediterranean fruit fly) hypothetical protein n=1 Tax=Ceratitis capitata TaxID=7213 RepID=A0A811VBK9_CERCA|nr:unnamed protein product [Ceratitis capitata]